MNPKKKVLASSETSVSSKLLNSDVRLKAGNKESKMFSVKINHF